MKHVNIDIKKVANLAKLKLSQEEISTYEKQLDEVVSYIEQMAELKLDGVEPLYHSVEFNQRLREDVSEVGLGKNISHEDILKNAPSKAMDCFKVPQVKEQS